MTNHAHLRELRGLAFDDVETGADASMLMKEDGSPIVDSAKAHRILSGCVGRLSTDDMMTIAEMMKDKDMIDQSEMEALKAAMSGDDGEKGDDPTTAMDSARGSRRRPTSTERKAFEDRFPNMNRLK